MRTNYEPVHSRDHAVYHILGNGGEFIGKQTYSITHKHHYISTLYISTECDTSRAQDGDVLFLMTIVFAPRTVTTICYV